MQAPVRIAIFASGGGSNARELLKYFSGSREIQVSLLVTNNPQSGVFGLGEQHNVPVVLLTPEEVRNGGLMVGMLHSHAIAFVVLAGYLRLIPEAVVRAFPRKILNIHPSLLPAFGGRHMYGMRVHEAVIQAGATQSGITVHYIDEAYDQGETIFQAETPVTPGMTPEALQQAVQFLEHTHFPRLVAQEALLLFQAQISHPMETMTPVRSALVSVYHKDGLDQLAAVFRHFGVQVISTGGTAAYLRELGLEVTEVADLTGYPSILGGRVKTLHPRVHGGILARRENPNDLAEMDAHDISPIDLVVVDLYPFQQTVSESTNEAEIIEKIDIGGIALIRAAAKNFNHVACIPSQTWYAPVAEWLQAQGGRLSLKQRKALAGAAFDVSSQYDSDIYRFFEPDGEALKLAARPGQALRYGENPHQKAWFYGKLENLFEQLHGKALSFNNLADLESALSLLDEFESTAFAVIKHTNACGCALGETVAEAWEKALEADPTSAFGGVLATNGLIDRAAAAAIDQIFFEALIAPEFTHEALEILRKKKNRILLQRKRALPAQPVIKSALGGYLVQEPDQASLALETVSVKTSRKPDPEVWQDLIFGEKVCKHLKSNAIALVRNGQLIGSGVGQTSRIDALKQAFDKAAANGFDVQGAVLVSDAFFPFADSVAFAYERGVEIVVQPGGSLRDDETINFCEAHNMCLIFTGLRHFLH